MRTLYKAFLSIAVVLVAVAAGVGIAKKQVGNFMEDKSLYGILSEDEGIDLNKDEIEKLIQRTENILTDEEKEKLEEITKRHVDSIIDIDELYLLMQKDDKDEFIKWVKNKAITEEEIDIIKEMIHNHKDEIYEIAKELKEEGLKEIKDNTEEIYEEN